MLQVEAGTENACTTNAAGVKVCGSYKLSEAFYNACEVPGSKFQIFLLIG